MNFLVAEGAQARHFIDYFFRRSTLLATPGIRNNTERTKLVAAFDDRYEGYEGRTPLGGRYIPLVTNAAFIQIDD
jgi:hypothetical protein